MPCADVLVRKAAWKGGAEGPRYLEQRYRRRLTSVGLEEPVENDFGNRVENWVVPELAMRYMGCASESREQPEKKLTDAVLPQIATR